MIKTILDNEMAEDSYDQTAFFKEYFNKDWTGKDIQLATNGPTNLITSIQLDSYPFNAAKIKKVFLTPQSAPAFRYPGLGTFTIQHPGKLGQEAEAKKELPQY